MPELKKGTVLADPAVPGSPAGATHHAEYGVGGYHTGHGTLADRDAIPVERRQWWMVVPLLDGTKWELVPGLNSQELADNANWQPSSADTSATTELAPYYLLSTDENDLPLSQGYDTIPELLTAAQQSVAEFSYQIFAAYTRLDAPTDLSNVRVNGAGGAISTAGFLSIGGYQTRVTGLSLIARGGSVDRHLNGLQLQDSQVIGGFRLCYESAEQAGSIIHVYWNNTTGQECIIESEGTAVIHLRNGSSCSLAAPLPANVTFDPPLGTSTSEGGSYTLPTASAITRGGIRLGEGWTLTDGDVLPFPGTDNGTSYNDEELRNRIGTAEGNINTLAEGLDATVAEVTSQDARLDAIEGLIPASASPTNPLATKGDIPLVQGDGGVLYDGPGQNTDGAMTQRATTAALSAQGERIGTAETNISTLATGLDAAFVEIGNRVEKSGLTDAVRSTISQNYPVGVYTKPGLRYVPVVFYGRWHEVSVINGYNADPTTLTWLYRPDFTKVGEYLTLSELNAGIDTLQGEELNGYIVEYDQPGNDTSKPSYVKFLWSSVQLPPAPRGHVPDRLGTFATRLNDGTTGGGTTPGTPTESATFLSATPS